MTEQVSDWPEVTDVFQSTRWTNKMGMGKWVTKIEELVAQIAVAATRRKVVRCCVYGAGTLSLLKEMLQVNKLRVKISGVGYFEEFPGPWGILTNTEK